MKKLILLISLILITACSSPNNGEQKPETLHADVIDRHGHIEGIEYLDDFVEKYESMKTLRLIRYTIEGDPIVYDLEYKNNQFLYTRDTTRDKFGSGSITETTCQSIDKEETETYLAYDLHGCDGEQKDQEFLFVSFDLMKQDYFEVILQYGHQIENEINTKDNKLVEKQQNSELKETSDFDLTDENMQMIYKEFVLSNLLRSKTLPNQCNNQASLQYQLTIYINSGTTEYTWKSCDTSADEKKLTEIAEKIISLTKTHYQ